MNTNLWKEKKVLITGGTSGLGRELSVEMLARGARVAVVARHVTEERLPSGAIGIEADVSSKDDVYRIAGEALSRLGGLDLLVNNASTLGPTPLRLLLDTECEDFSQVLETNLLGPFRLTKALLPTLLLGHGGTVVNISSDAAVSAYPLWGAYSASKAALDQLSRVWHEELKEHGVRFVAVDPGDMDTPLHAAALPDADRAKLRQPRDSALALLAALESPGAVSETVRRSL